MPATNRQLEADARRRPPDPPPRYLGCIEVTERWAAYLIGEDGQPLHGVGLALPAGAQIVSIQPVEREIHEKTTHWEDRPDYKPMREIVTRWLAFFVIEEEGRG